MRPTRYFVEWDAAPADADWPDHRMENTGDDRDEALRVARGIAREERRVVLVVERTNIHDVTPPEDPPGLLWDWEENWEGTEEVLPPT